MTDQGSPPGEARRLAVLQLGGVEQAKERVRTARHGAWLDEAARDIRYAVRTAARNPGFTIVVVLTLVLGIGANTAIFSLIDALMLRWLPVRAPQDLVLLTSSADGQESEVWSDSFFRALSDQNEIFSANRRAEGLAPA